MQVKFYVPSIDKNNNYLIDRENRIKAFTTLLTDLFGGCTTYLAEGKYLMDSGEQVCERVAIVEVYTNEIDKCRNIAHDRLTLWNQECIALVINNNLEFIK